jgi:hypothetical protein
MKKLFATLPKTTQRTGRKHAMEIAWIDGSRPFFWRWDPDYVDTVWDGLRLWYKGPPNHCVPQKNEPDPVRK